MVSCDICDKEFKNTQGLRGHKTFVHRNGSPNNAQVTRVTTEQPVSLLEDRLQQIERVTGLCESDIDFSLSGSEPLTDRLTNITEQVTKLSDTVSKLCEEVELSKVAMEIESEEFNKRLADLLEAYNRQSVVIDKHRDTFNTNFDVMESRIGKVQKIVEDLSEGLNTVRTKLTTHGHDGLSLMPQLSNRLEQVGEQITGLQSGVARAQVLAVRKPTDDFERLELTNGSKHTFRVYKGKRGLSNPHRISIDPFLGDKYVDLAEPED